MKLRLALCICLAYVTVSYSAQKPSAGRQSRLAQYGKVELIRDAWGVPHIFAQSDAGAMYGLGYACAQDRGFQMYYFLRIMQGRSAELLGDIRRSGKARPITAAENDALMRSFGFARGAQDVVKHLDTETLKMLEAYSQGVNDGITQNTPRKHPLFEQTGLKPEPWTPAACILSWWHVAQFFAKNGLNDAPALRPLNQNRYRGAQVAPDEEAAVVRREDVSDEWIGRVNEFVKSHGIVPKQEKGPDTPDPKFSHAWVIGGKKTSTGAAVLISDPQTPVWNPNMFYEFHVNGKTFNARGMGAPGSPLILIGFNEQVAWGMTALGADQADLFLLQTEAGRPNQYEVDGQWLDMELLEENIRIKDADSRPLTIRKTIFGPVVSDWVARRPKDKEFALARVPMAETDQDTIQAMLPMFRARSCADFAAALPKWRFPTANCVFGDAQGNIGYWSLGALPVRSALSKYGGATAQDGTTRASLWQGMIPYELLPHVINPQRGYLVTANHRTIQSFYKMPFGNMTGSSGDTDRGLRIKERINEHLSARKRVTPQDMLAIQDDCVSVWKREIARIGFTLLEQEDQRLSGPAKQALLYLRPWYDAGAAMDTGLRGTELAEKMSVIFRGGRFGLVSQFGGGVSGLARFAKHTRKRYAANPNVRVTDDEAVFADTVLRNAWMQCQRSYGDDPDAWLARATALRTAQTMPYMGSLDAYPGLDAALNLALPRLKTQDGSTVLSQRAQAYTQFVPLHDVDASLSILPPGQSEDPASPFRFSTYALWAQAQLHPAPLSRKASEAIMASVRDLTATPTRPQRPQPPKTPLPGKKPDDPILEGAIRYLNRAERSQAEVQAKIRELDRYVLGQAQRKQELILGLELFIHLMKESQAGRMPIRYGTPETLALIEPFYKRLKDPQ